MSSPKALLDMKHTSLQAIADLKRAAIGASPEELSIINKMILVEQNNVGFADVALSCHQIADCTLPRVA